MIKLVFLLVLSVDEHTRCMQLSIITISMQENLDFLYILSSNFVVIHLPCYRPIVGDQQ